MGKVDEIEKQKRIYQVGLMLRRKPVSFIIQYIADNWHLEKRQAHNYIKKARIEWKKYFEKLKGDGISYHVAQMRDLKDKAYIDGDQRLVFDITKEEAKLMGIYPAEKFEVTEKKVIVIGKKKDKKDDDKEK